MKMTDSSTVLLTYIVSLAPPLPTESTEWSLVKYDDLQVHLIYKNQYLTDWYGSYRKRDIFHILVHFSKGCNDKGQANQSQESVQVSHISGRGPGTQVISAAFTGALSGTRWYAQQWALKLALLHGIQGSQAAVQLTATTAATIKSQMPL